MVLGFLRGSDSLFEENRREIAGIKVAELHYDHEKTEEDTVKIEL